MSRRTDTLRSRLPLLLALLATATPASAQLRSGAAARAERPSVSGVVYDSTARAVLPDAYVQLVPYQRTGKVYLDTSDARGRFSIADVDTGTYMLGFIHERLESVGIQPPVRLVHVTAADPDLRILLAIPGVEKLVSLHCSTPLSSDSAGLLLGRVRDVATGRPITDGVVALMWTELVLDRGGLRSVRRQFAGRTGENGFYAFCSVPSGGEVMARAEHGAEVSGYVKVSVPPGGVLVQDFRVAVPAGESASGSAELTGTVHGAGGEEIAGAQIVLWGTDFQTKSGSGGRFTLGGLPAGTYTVEVRYIGYQPRQANVDLLPGATVPVELALGEKIQQLQAVTVFGKPDERRSITGFLERMDRGMGRFYTREDIERQNPIRSTDIVRMTPGIVVAPTGGIGYAVLMHGTTGNCAPDVWVDGARVYDGYRDLDAIVNPQDIAGVEVYAREIEAPPQYRSMNGCGTILIWTGRSVR